MDNISCKSFSCNAISGISWKNDNTLEVTASNGQVFKLTGISFANYMILKDNPKLLNLIVKRTIS